MLKEKDLVKVCYLPRHKGAAKSVLPLGCENRSPVCLSPYGLSDYLGYVNDVLTGGYNDA